jgi:hypothetical protein
MADRNSYPYHHHFVVDRRSSLITAKQAAHGKLRIAAGLFLSVHSSSSDGLVNGEETQNLSDLSGVFSIWPSLRHP